MDGSDTWGDDGLFRAIFDAAPTPFLVVAPPDWSIVAANDARLLVTGMTREDQIGRKLFDVFPDDPRDPNADGVRNLTASLERVMATRKTDTMSVQRYAVREPGGEFVERWWTPVNTPVLSADGEVAFIIHRVEDVTELVSLRGEAQAVTQLALNQQAVIDQLRASQVALRDSEERLRVSEEFNRRVLASSADCIKVLDLEGRLEFMSEGGKWVMEVDDFEVIKGSYWPDFWTGDGHALAVGALEAAKAETKGRFQGFATTMKGSPRWWDVIVTPITGREGRPEKLLCISRDITITKEAEVRVRELNESLEQRVIDRTAALVEAQEALRHSQKMEAVGQLTGGLAHDFNNLLAGISGSLELMQTRIGQGRVSELDRYMAVAQGAARRAAALTHRLLAFSRRQTLDPKTVNVNRLVSELEELIRRTVGPSVTLEVVGASGLWAALVDPSQLENALLNLCLNARDAMPDGGRITIETANKWLDEVGARQHDMPPGQYLSVCVTDTGCGMAPDTIAKAFDPFFTTKPIGEGTGLGLSMVYGFARQSGGQVRIYSEVGQGTTVCIYLPRQHAGAEFEEIAPRKRDLTRTGRDETVLIVDDEPSVRMLISEVLEDLGYLSIEAADSSNGLKLLQSKARIDLLVTDVGLPGGMNGRQMADAGREHRPELKVLFITGYAENAAVGNGHLGPGMQLLTKPFALQDLASRIEELIRVA